MGGDAKRSHTSASVGQRALNFGSFGGESFVLGELDGCLLASASILARHRFQAGADAGELGDLKFLRRQLVTCNGVASKA